MTDEINLFHQSRPAVTPFDPVAKASARTRLLQEAVGSAARRRGVLGTRRRFAIMKPMSHRQPGGETMAAAVSRDPASQTPPSGPPSSPRRIWVPPVLAAAAVGLVAIVAAMTGLASSSVRSQPAGAPSRTPGAPASVAADFQQRARQAVAQWERYGLDQRWRDGHVLLDNELTIVPSTARFTSKAASESIRSGWFQLATHLPHTGPSTGAIRWADGRTQNIGVPDAATAYAQMSRRQPCGAPDDTCPVYTVTAATPGVPATIATSRGPATMPTWDFTLAQAPFHVREVAVDMTAFSRLPDTLSAQTPFGPPWPFGSSGVRASDHGRVLTLQFAGDPCATAWGAQVYQTPSVVVVTGWNTGRRQAHDLSYCDPRHNTLELRIAQRTLTVHLHTPLGDRVVLDLQGGPQVVAQG